MSGVAARRLASRCRTSRPTRYNGVSATGFLSAADRDRTDPCSRCPIRCHSIASHAAELTSYQCPPSPWRGRGLFVTVCRAVQPLCECGRRRRQTDRRPREMECPVKTDLTRGVVVNFDLGERFPRPRSRTTTPLDLTHCTF